MDGFQTWVHPPLIPTGPSLAPCGRRGLTGSPRAARWLPLVLTLTKDERDGVRVHPSDFRLLILLARAVIEWRPSMAGGLYRGAAQPGTRGGAALTTGAPVALRGMRPKPQRLSKRTSRRPSLRLTLFGVVAVALVGVVGFALSREAATTSRAGSPQP